MQIAIFAKSLVVACVKRAKNPSINDSTCDPKTIFKIVIRHFFSGAKPTGQGKERVVLDERLGETGYFCTVL